MVLFCLGFGLPSHSAISLRWAPLATVFVSALSFLCLWWSKAHLKVAWWWKETSCLKSKIKCIPHWVEISNPYHFLCYIFIHVPSPSHLSSQLKCYSVQTISYWMSWRLDFHDIHETCSNFVCSHEGTFLANWRGDLPLFEFFFFLE